MEEKLTQPESVATFREAYMDLERVYSSFSKLCGLSDAEYWALVMIQEGVTTQRDISEQLCLSKQTVHSAFTQLVKKDLVQLAPMEGNLRVKQARLTKNGERFAEKYINSMHALEEDVWNDLTLQERIAFTQVINKYKNSLRSALEAYEPRK